MKKRLTFAIVLLPLVVVGCGATTITPGEPFQPSEQRFFDDGIDVVADINALQGQFGFEAREDMDARCNLADVIAQVTIESVHSSTRGDGVAETLISVKINQIIYGELSTGEFQLRSNANSLGYTLLKRHESAINGEKLLFLRTFEMENETNERGLSGETPVKQTVGHHFHLSPNSSAVLGLVQKYIQKRKGAESGKTDESVEGNTGASAN
ncbi:MAG: hypothetical protein JXR76_07010 [Deltaproteobacteria bacterium]|nr:hypothetical protein [Deltaproteobacteria bacterium]